MLREFWQWSGRHIGTHRKWRPGALAEYRLENGESSDNRGGLCDREHPFMYGGNLASDKVATLAHPESGNLAILSKNASKSVGGRVTLHVCGCWMVDLVLGKA